METIDLIQSYLTEKRLYGISRSNTKGLNGLRMCHSRNPEIHLAWISAQGAKATVDSVYLKELSVSRSNKTVIDLVDPQGLEKLEKLLQTIADKFNTFNVKLNSYKGSISTYLRYPADSCGQHKFKDEA